MIATFLTLFVLPVLYLLFENINLKKMKRHTGLTLLAVILLSAFYSNNGYAQMPIKLKAAIDTAISNNLSLKSERLNAEYQQKLIKSSAVIPATSIFGEAGQINSAYTDTKFGISQSISFPTVYSRQKALLKEEFTGSEIAVAVKEVEIKKLVSDIFNNLSWLFEKKKLLLRTDSLYSGFLQKANLRFQKGESNLLEKATAENQQGQIAIQLKQLEQDIQIVQIQFQLALKTNTKYIPSSESFKEEPSNTGFTESTQHPRVQFLQQQNRIALANTLYQKSKLSPDLIFGYNNTSIRGTGADDKYYPASKRFQAVQIGVGIPIFNGAQKAVINASKVKESIAENDYEIGLQALNGERVTALLQYQKYLQTTGWYEDTALKSAETISATATKQFVNGEINYLNWVVLMNQAVAIQSQYIDAIKNLNETIHQINYLNSK